MADILLVDDHADCLQMLQLLLKRNGHRVVVAHDGFAGIQAALAHPPDVVVLDIAMPRMDGYELAKILRTTYACADLPLIATSGLPRDEARAEEAEIDFYLLKPVSPRKLLDLIAAVTVEAAPAGSH